MSKAIDLRLRRIERAMKSSPYDDLSDEELNEIIRTNLEILIEPYGRDITALRDAYARSVDAEEREIAKHLDDIIANIHEIYPQAEPGRL